MYRLSYIALGILISINVWSQNPHGNQFVVDCATCHNPDGWNIAMDTFQFNHDTTAFVLEGQHKVTDCKSCHSTLIFNQVQNDCISCHTDVHSMSVGNDCVRCHTSENWLVDDIPEIHEQNGFPLMGAHDQLHCVDCHISETNLRFERLGNDCINCHQEDYLSTQSPNHTQAGFSTNCQDCHTPENNTWSTDLIDHSFFPLTLGHDIQDCKMCHTTDNFSDASPDCIFCHRDEYVTAYSPNHESLNFTTDCTACHTTNPGWTPAEFVSHDTEYFPIYSGSHEGEWSDCLDCHTDPQNYSLFTCISCHQNPETNEEHEGVSGYQYEDNACLACHPNGDADLIFDHNTTNFALTGAHIGAECLDCHSDGFEGTPSSCVSCHTIDFSEAANPDHVVLNLPNDCASCHTTDPEWTPASFDIHDNFYPLNGAHALISTDCATCHNGDYNNTPNTCVGCHLNDYNETVDPDHSGANFSTDCTQCHSESEWKPSTFDHDSQYFPIYSGAHDGEWSDCIDCHTNPNNYQEFQCTNCHINPETDEEHLGISGYVYDDNACLACHPTGDADMAFNHDATNFPLSGAHLGIDCLECHSNGYEGTPTECAACHILDFSEAANPNHTTLNLPNDCASCHTTDPGWMPATFDIHDDFYQLNGAHALISADCATCHNGDYNNTPNTCVGCHLNDYNETVDPDHSGANFSTDCAQCHTESEWEPSTFDHDAQYFPIYSGAHDGEWSDCIDCHTNPNNYQEFQCTNCHINPETDEEHLGISGYIYNDNACLACHPTGDTDMAFNHDATDFPLSGAHLGLDCLECHSNGYEGTSTDCIACHTIDFSDAANPNHTTLNLPNDCAACHTTDPGWMPATFDIHNDFYALNGAHAMISNDCAVCHNGDYSNTPNTCIACHQMEYDNTSDPDHNAAQFNTECMTCHNESSWTPASFDHDAQYFPIYSGAHDGEWSDCLDCHTNPNNFSEFQCTNCHINPETDDEHEGVGGYMYENNACLACHPMGDAEMALDHNNTGFALTGAHTDALCLDCHANGYAGTSTDCNDCHNLEFNATSNPNHSAIGITTDCISCHTTDPGWSPASFEIHDNYFALTGAHIPIANDCIDCHNGDYNNTPNTCAGCHQTDFENTVNPDHQVLNLSTDCATCHTTDLNWMPANFDNHDDFYPLNGAHAIIAMDCANCHNGDYNNTPNTCVGCHQAEYDNTTNPNHTSVMFPTDCAQCHTESEWTPSTFDHDGQYFPIYTGTHAGEWSDCMDCHNNPNNFSEFVCTTCHMNPQTDNEHSGVGGYIYNDNACLACHPIGEADMAVDHNTTNFPLTGAHIGVDCIECHMSGYQGTSTVCNDCHNTDFATSVNPNHSALGISTDCIACHTTDPGWSPATFDIHDNYYALTGAHVPIANDCALCHNGDYNNTPNTCAACHTTDYNASTNPNHASLGIPTDCESCHTTDPGWTPASFSIHDNYYTLTGAHVPIANDCAICHNGDYNNTPNTCAGCHQTDFDNTVNPDHQALNLSNDCASCHTTDLDWMPATFAIHDNYYPLNGAHAIIADNCIQCHNGDYNNTPNTCIGCHQSDFDNTTNPDHVTAMFPTDCTQCHSEAAWVPATFDHNTIYPLDGAHAPIANDCLQCHSGGYQNTPNTCVACHQSDYNMSVNPDHQALNLPNDCASCHTTDVDWMPATFAIHDNYYPLNGAHAIIADNCIQCHNGDYNNTPNTCIGCHQSDFDNTTNPDHVAAMLPTDCTQCHTETAWVPATFDHNTIYPLNGAHALIANDCLQCHSGGYQNTPNTCIGCHQSDYNNANNPDHNTAGFPTDCTQCHTETAWTPSTFDHDGMYFPIYSGKHDGEWTTCMECHFNPNDYTLFSCIDCHEHNNQTEVDADHNEVNNYMYESNACYACHPTGEN